MSSAALKPRRLVIAGLGNYSHPLTRHSIGQLVLTHLALKAASLPGSSGSGVLKLGKHQGKQAWTATVTVQQPPPPPPPPVKQKWIPRNQRSPDGAQGTAISSAGAPEAELEVVAEKEPPAPPAPQPLELLFVLPKLLMNVSGPAITAFASLPVTSSGSPKPRSGWASTFRTPPASSDPFLPSPPPPFSIVTLQDDLDLASFVVKVQRGGGPRGHNGVRSLTSALGGSRDFWRIRLGVGRPPDAGKKSKSDRGDVAGWVLSPLGGDEVKACEWEEGKGGGRVLDAVWDELVRIGWAEEQLPETKEQ